MPEVGSLFVRLRADASEFQQAIQGAAQGLKDVGDQITGVGKGLSKSVTAPLLGIAAAAVTVGMDFDAQMSKVMALSGATGDEFTALRELAKQLGADTRFSATQAAQGMEYMALAGWDAQQTMAAMPGLLQLAAAAGMDLGRASDIVTDTMSAFKIEASEATYVADQFAAAQSKSNTNVNQLGEALKMVAPNANAAGMSLAQTAGALGVLADNGLKGSMAGTTLNAMLRDLLGNVQDGQVDFGSFNVAVFDAEGQMRSFGDIMHDVEAGTQGLSGAQREAALRSVFQAQSLRGVNIMLSDGIDRYDELTGLIENSNGLAAEQARIMEDNLAGAVTQLKSQFEGLMIQLSDVLAPVIRDEVVPVFQALMSHISRAIGWFGNLDSGVQRTIIALLGIAAAIGPVLIGVGTAIKVIGALVGVVAAVLTPVGLLVVAIGALAAAFATDFMGIRTAVMGAITPIISLLSGELMPVFEAVKDVIANLFAGDLSAAAASLGDVWSALVGMDWSGIGAAIWGALSELGAALLSLAGDIYGWVADAIAGVDWAGLGSQLLEYAKTVLGALGDLAGAGLDLAGDLYAWIAGELGSVDWVTLANTVADSLASAVSTAVSTAVGLGEALASWVTTQATEVDWSGVGTSVVDGITGAMTDAWAFIESIELLAPLVDAFETAAAVLEPIGAAILGALEPIWDNIRTSAAPVLNELKLLWESLRPALDALVPLLTMIGAIIGGVLVAALGVLMGGLGGFVGLLTGALPGAIRVVTGLIEYFTGLINLITTVVTGMVNIVKNLIQGDFRGAWEAAKTMVSGAAEAIKTMITGLKDIVIGLISGLAGGVTGLISGFVESFIGFFRNLYNTIVGNSIIPDMVNGIINWISQLPGEVLGFISGMVADVLGKMGEFAGDMLAKGQEVVQNVIDGMLGLLDGVVGAAGDLIDGVLGAFSDAGTFLLQAGKDIVQGLIDGIGGMVEAAKQKAQEVASGVKNAITGFFGISSPSKVMAGVGKDTILGLALGMSKTEGEAVKAAADVAKSVIDTLSAALKLAGDLSRFRGEINIPALDSLIDLSHRVVDAMAGIARRFDDELIKRTKEITGAISDSFKALGEAVEFAETLTRENIVVPGNEVVSDLKFWAEHAVRSLGDSGAHLGTGLMEAASEFSGAMEDTFAAMGAAVAFARDVAQSRVVLPSYELISDIKFLAEHAVRSLGDSGAYLGDGLMDAARAFAEAMVDSIGAMAEAVRFSRQVAESEVVLPSNDLISDLKFMSEHVVQSLGDSGAYVGSAGMANAKAFGDAMKSAFSALGEAVKFSLSVMDTRIEQPSRRLIRQLADTARDVVRAMAAAAEQLGPQLLAAAERAGGGVKAAFDAIGAALKFVVDATDAMRDGVIRDVPRALVDMLAALAAAVTEAFAEATARFESEVLEAVEGSSGAVKAVLDVFSAAVGYVKTAAELEEKEGAPDAAAALTGALTTLIVGIVNAFVSAAQRMQTEALAAAKSFAEAIKPLVDLVSPIVQAAKSITDMSAITEKEMGIFTGNVGKIATVIERSAALADEARRSAEEFARNAHDTLRSVQEGVAALYSAANIAASAPTVSPPPAPATTEVPALASGGVVTKPTLALIGETTQARPEIVAPEPVLRGVLRDELRGAAPGVDGDALRDAVAAIQRVARELQRVLRGAVVLTRGVMGGPRDAERLIRQVMAAVERMAPVRAAPVPLAMAGGPAAAAGGIEMHIHIDQVIATDRREAERAAGDLAWGVMQTLRQRGLA